MTTELPTLAQTDLLSNRMSTTWFLEYFHLQWQSRKLQSYSSTPVVWITVCKWTGGENITTANPSKKAVAWMSHYVPLIHVLSSLSLKRRKLYYRSAYTLLDICFFLEPNVSFSLACIYRWWSVFGATAFLQQCLRRWSKVWLQWFDAYDWYMFSRMVMEHS
jgi:hypothetical protein